MSSLGEIRAVLAEVAEHTRTAAQSADLARAGLDEATAVLHDLGRQHHESLVPPSLSRAGAELDKAQQALGVAAVAVADLDARL